MSNNSILISDDEELVNSNLKKSEYGFGYIFIPGSVFFPAIPFIPKSLSLALNNPPLVPANIYSPFIAKLLIKKLVKPSFLAVQLLPLSVDRKKSPFNVPANILLP